MLLVYLLCLAIITSGQEIIDLDQEPLERDEIIDAVNSAETTWKAGRNFNPLLKKSRAKYLINTGKPQNQETNTLIPRSNTVLQNVPTEFDARTYWSDCKCISTVHDQGPCAASWAVASAAVMTDRFCIANEGYFPIPLSAENILTCYREWGNCTGYFDMTYVWSDIQYDGVVTGGAYHSHQGCQPYSLPACEHHVVGKRKNCYAYKNVKVPKCSANCTNPKYKTPYKKDLYKAQSTFYIQFDEKQTKTDLYSGGPLLAIFSVYEDFLSYKTGVYQHITGRFLGTACARILGWGVDNGTEYWIAANSWNTDWGDNGFFKIKRGNNECDFEAEVYGGIPDVQP